MPSKTKSNLKYSIVYSFVRDDEEGSESIEKVPLLTKRYSSFIKGKFEAKIVAEYTHSGLATVECSEQIAELIAQEDYVKSVQPF